MKTTEIPTDLLEKVRKTGRKTAHDFRNFSFWNESKVAQICELEGHSFLDLPKPTQLALFMAFYEGSDAYFMEYLNAKPS